MQFKVCGITDITQAQALEAMGVQYIGFIFYPSSKRYVLDKLNLTELANFKPVVAKKVGVFVNMELGELLHIVNSAGLDMVQLHGDETPEFCAAVREHVKTIKVFRVGAEVPAFVLFENKITPTKIKNLVMVKKYLLFILYNSNFISHCLLPISILIL
jgi:phosphoribosylanthranilate isomerase